MIKTIFMGTPLFAVPILKALSENTEVILVVTQPDKYVGRKKIKTHSPVKNWALENNIPVFQPNKKTLAFYSHPNFCPYKPEYTNR